MKNRFLTKGIWLFVIIIISTVFFTTCENPTNAFLGTGNPADTEPPKLSITSHKDRDLVSGDIVISGIATDDILIKEVRLYSYIDNARQLLQTTTVGWDHAWSFLLNTRVFADGTNIFVVEAIDVATPSNLAAENLILRLDNYGPTVVINSPNNSTGTQMGPFSVDLTLVSVRNTTEVEWEVYAKNDESIKISGTRSNSGVALATPDKFGYSFILSEIVEISGKVGPVYPDGFFVGDIVLRVRAKDDKDRYSKEWTEKVVALNFDSYKPVVYISTPVATTSGTANTYGGSGITATGMVTSDAQLKELILELSFASSSTHYDVTIDLSADSSPVEFRYLISEKLGAPGSPIEDGTYKVRGKAFTMGGVESVYTPYYYFTIDSNYPSVTFSNPQGGSWDKGDVTVMGNATVGGGGTLSSVAYSINNANGPWTPLSLGAGGSFSILVNGGTLIKSEVIVYVKAMRGSDSTTGVLIFNIDNISPIVKILKPGTSDTGLNQVITVEGTASDTADSLGAKGTVNSIKAEIKRAGDLNFSDLVGVTINGTENWYFNFDTSSYGINGNEDVTIRITGTDRVGNSSSVTQVLHINQLADIPWVAIDETSLSNGNDKLYGLITVTGGSFDDDGVRAVYTKVVPLGADVLAHSYTTGWSDSDTYKWERASGTTEWSARINCVNYAQGDHILYACALDINGKESYFRNDISYRSLGPAPANKPSRDKVPFRVDPNKPVVSFYLEPPTSSSAPLEKDHTVYVKTNSILYGKATKTNGVIQKLEFIISGTNRIGGGALPLSYAIDSNSAPVGSGITISGMGTATVSFTYTVATSMFADGDVDILVRATDDGKKIDGQSVIFQVDTVVPIVKLIQPLAGHVQLSQYFVLSGSSEDAPPSSGLLNTDGKVVFTHTNTGESFTYITPIPSPVNEWTFNDPLQSSVKDGLYTITFTQADRAGNSSSTSVTNVRLARYPAYINTGAINGDTLRNGVSIKRNSTYTFNLKEDSVNDQYPGFKEMKVYLYDQNTITNYSDSSLVLLNTKTWTQPNTDTSATHEFTYNYTSSPSSPPKYLIVELTDRAGYTAKKAYDVKVDFVDPVHQFKLTSVKGTQPPTTVMLNNGSGAGYSSSLWIKLDAIDKDGVIAPGINDQDMSAAQISVALSSYATDPAADAYTTIRMGDYFKRDTKVYHQNVTGDTNYYLHYKIPDPAGNIAKGYIILKRETNLPQFNSVLINGDTYSSATLEETIAGTKQPKTIWTKSLNITGTITVPSGNTLSSVIFSKLEFNRADHINDIATDSSGNVATGNNFSYTIPAISDTEGNVHTITALATLNNNVNWDQTIAFIYDNVPPVINSLKIKEIPNSNDGRVFTLDSNRVPTTVVAELDSQNARISGKVRIFGTFSDNLGAKQPVSDFKLTVSIDGTDYLVPSLNIEKDPSDSDKKSFTFYFDYDSALFGSVKKDVQVRVKLADKAKNEATPKALKVNIAPYLLSITTNSAVQDVRKYKQSTDSWENINDNMRYSYRIDSGSITVKGFNLYSPSFVLTYVRDVDSATRTITPTTRTDTSITFNPRPDSLTYDSNLKSGYFYITTGAEALETNKKVLYIFDNYGATSYDMFADEQDMVIDPYKNSDNPLAVFVLQKHYQNNTAHQIKSRYYRRDNFASGAQSQIQGSGLYRGYETDVGTFLTLDGNTDGVLGVGKAGYNYITHGFNRYWFTTIARDPYYTTALQVSNGQKDSVYYLYTSDTENIAGSTRGAFVSGSRDYWNRMGDNPYNFADSNNKYTIAEFSWYADTNTPIFMPVNDWWDAADGTPSPSLGVGKTKFLRNAWRTGAVDWNNTNGTGTDDGTLSKDWSTVWGDVVAYKDNIYTAGYNASLLKTTYRRIKNQNTNSPKYPEVNPLDLGFAGEQPTIAVDPRKAGNASTENSAAYIVGVDNSNNGAVKLAKVTNDLLATSNSENVTVLGSSGGYPSIAISDVGIIHLVYQDIGEGTIKYTRFSADNWSSIPTENSPSYFSNYTVTLDNVGSPGYFSHITLDSSGMPIITYLTIAEVGTPSAVKIARAVADPTNADNWEIVTVPMKNNISLIKVRGYSWNGKMIGAAKSTYPEVFREYNK